MKCQKHGVPRNPSKAQSGTELYAMEIEREGKSPAARGEVRGISAVLSCLYEWELEKLERLLADAPPLDIFEAAALGKVDRVAELLRDEPYGAFAQSAEGFTPLHLACFYGQQKVAVYLLDHGASPSVPAGDESGVTPLHESASTGQQEIVSMLLARGAEIDATDSEGSTALHMAACNGQLEVVETLVCNGARFSRNRDGHRPRDLALLNGHLNIARLFDALAGDGLWPPVTARAFPSA